MSIDVESATISHDIADETARRWDTFMHGYIPPSVLQVAPDLQFHTEVDSDVDAVTYEVIRSKFWNLNWDHQEAIRRTSGSPVVVHAYDFNCCIQDEIGDGVVFGPGNLFFAGCADVVVKWTLEHRSMNVGINEGDIFIQDDPWVGTNHQMDAAIYKPIFIDGRLFAWLYNVAHQRDLGGVEPGGFVQAAEDVFFEATFWPPVKLGEGGILREDILDAWVRRSRIPRLMMVEVKAQLAGLHVAEERLRAMVDRYGAPRVKGVMKTMIQRTADTVAARLEAIPDGTWTDRRYLAGALPDDKRLYQLSLAVRKEGGRLTFMNEGTDRATGAFNIPKGVARACVTCSLLTQLGYDQLLGGAGVLRQVDFDFVDGAINSATHPSAVSTALGLVATLVQSQYLLAKMLSANPEVRSHIFAASGLHTVVTNHTFGRDQRGRPFANFSLDGTVGGVGAFAFRDGMDHGGGAFSTINPVGSVEVYEQEIPFLYLYRRELPDSGGHGQWRGGATFVSAWTGHKTDRLFISSGGLIQAVTQGHGLLGGYPSTGGRMWRAEDSQVLDNFARGTLPKNSEELHSLAANGGPPPAKKFDNRLLPGDLFEVMPQPGAGYGDPLLRSVEAVRYDVSAGRVSRADAQRLYGLNDAALDGTATDDEIRRSREAVARARLADASPPADAPGGLAREIGPFALATVAIGANDDGEHVLACAYCSAILAFRSGNYRTGCAVHELPLEAISVHFMNPEQATGEVLLLRQFLCPGCGLCLDADVAKPGDEVWRDVSLD